jgi:hypothetical protein
VYALAVTGQGVYIGGLFNGAGTTSRPCALEVDHSGSLMAWNPKAGGLIHSIAVSGSTVYLGGQLQALGTSKRGGAGAVTATSGNVLPWNPNIETSGDVKHLEVNGSTVYLTGDFTTAGGAPRSGAAAFTTAGALLPWRTNMVGIQIQTAGLIGDKVMVGGDFHGIAQVARNHAFAINANGLIQPWNPSITGGYRSTVKAITVSGTNVYLGGTFTTVGTSPRSNIAAVSTSGVVQPWNPGVTGQSVNSIAVSGANVYFGGAFSKVGTSIRANAAAVNLSGVLQPWNPAPNGTVNSLLVSGISVFLGGKFSKLGAIFRNNAAAVATTGPLLPWNPNVGNPGGYPKGSSYAQVKAMAISGSTIYMGGNFGSLGATPRRNLAAIGTNGRVLDWAPLGADYGDVDMDLDSVSAISVLGSNIYFGGGFMLWDSASRKAYRNAASASTSGALGSWLPPEISGDVYAIDPSAQSVLVGGGISGVGKTTVNNFASFGPTGTFSG